MNYFQLYKKLTSCENEQDSITNLIDSIKYHKNAKIFIEIFNKLSDSNIDYKIISGFKGTKIYKEQSNEFKSCIINVNNDSQIDNILKEYDELIVYNVNNDNIEIQLRD